MTEKEWPEEINPTEIAILARLDAIGMILSSRYKDLVVERYYQIQDEIKAIKSARSA